LFKGSIKSPQIVEFLKALQATIGKKLLIIWDGLRAHRSQPRLPSDSKSGFARNTPFERPSPVTLLGPP